MIIETLKRWTETIRSLITNLGALGIFTGVYALLLVTTYFYIGTREATVWQVFVTLAGLVVIPAEFFILQAAIIDHAKQSKLHWRDIVIDAVKCFMVTIPILLLGWLIWYLLYKWQAHYPPPLTALAEARRGAKPPAPKTHWPTILFATGRALIFGIALPLTTIQLWIEVAGTEVRALFGGGAASFFKRIGNACARAFSFDSASIYALGLIFFFVIPYALLAVRLTIKGNKTDFALFSLQLLLVFAFTLIGWVVTIASLTRNASRAPQARKEIAPDVSPGTPALQNP